MIIPEEKKPGRCCQYYKPPGGKIYRCWSYAWHDVPSAEKREPLVSNDDGESMSIIDTDSNVLVKTIETGKGYHQVSHQALSARSPFASVLMSQMPAPSPSARMR